MSNAPIIKIPESEYLELLRDRVRMDQLEYLDVTVRVPLVYGSREAFMSGPTQGDGEEYPSDIREQLDNLRKP